MENFGEVGKKQMVENEHACQSELGKLAILEKPKLRMSSIGRPTLGGSNKISYTHTNALVFRFLSVAKSSVRS